MDDINNKVGGSGINLDFYDITEGKNIGINDINFNSSRLIKYLKSQKGAGLISFIKYFFGLGARKKKFIKFVAKFEKVRTSLESLIKTFEVEAKTFERRANKNATLIYEYYVAFKYNSILHILKNNEGETLENFKLKKREDYEENILFYNFRVLSSSQIKKDVSMIDEYIKLNSYRIKEIENKLKGLKKIMMKDLKKKSILLGLFKGSNFFDKLKKSLEKDFNNMKKLMEERNIFTEDMEQASEAVEQYVELSKTEESELLPERKKVMKLYEKNKEYFDKLSRYTPEKLQPLFDILEKKSVLFARIEHYKKQYFSLKVETLKTEFRNWDTSMRSSYKLLKSINKDSNELAKEIGKTLDNIAFTINSLKVIQNKDVKEMLEDFKVVYQNLELCEDLQKSITNTSAAVLLKIGKMEPLKNIMKDMFNIKLAQSMVQNKMQYINDELSSKYQSVQINDYIRKRISAITGGSRIINNNINNLYTNYVGGGNYVGDDNINNKSVNFINMINNKIGGRAIGGAERGGSIGGSIGGAGRVRRRGRGRRDKIIKSINNYPTNFICNEDSVLTLIKKPANDDIISEFIKNDDITSNQTNFEYVYNHSKDTILSRNLNTDTDIEIPLSTGKIQLDTSNIIVQEKIFNMYISTLPNGFKYINYSDDEIINKLKIYDTEVKKKDSYFVFFNTKDNCIYIYKNFNTQLSKVEVQNDTGLNQGFIQIETSGIYYYNPFKKTTYSKIVSMMNYALYGIKIKLYANIIKIYILPIFYRTSSLKRNIINYDDFFLINPFTRDIYLTYTNYMSINKVKDTKNKFNFITGKDSFVDLEFKIINDEFLQYIQNESEKNDIHNNTNTIDKQFILTFTYNVDMFNYKYSKLNKYIYFHPGSNGYITNYNTKEGYGVYSNATAEFLDGNINGVSTSTSVTYNTQFTYNDLNSNIDTNIRTKAPASIPPQIDYIFHAEGLPPHHDKLSNIKYNIKKIKSLNNVKSDYNEIMINTVLQFCHINNCLFSLSSILYTKINPSHIKKNILKEHRKVIGGKFDNVYKHVNTRDLLINYYINKEYDYNLFKEIESNASLIDDYINYKYYSKEKLEILFKADSFLDTAKKYNLNTYMNESSESTLEFILVDASNVEVPPPSLPVVITAPVTGTAPVVTTPATGTAPVAGTTPASVTLSTEVTLTPDQENRYNFILNQLTETGVLDRLDIVYNSTEKFNISSPDAKYNEYNNNFNKCLNLMNENLKRESELVNTPKSVKKHKDFLTGFTYVTDKLDVKVKDDKNKATTPEGEELENIIKNNRKLISEVGEALNLTPKSVYYDSNMNAFIHKIIEWSSTKGASPVRDYNYLYNIKFDNFFINKTNVVEFIDEMKNDSFYKRDRDINAKIGKFFHYLPSFMSKNLSYYKDVTNEISDYIKEYKESIAPKPVAGKATTTPTRGVPAGTAIVVPTGRPGGP
jgi:hypothetical protein